MAERLVSSPLLARDRWEVGHAKDHAFLASDKYAISTELKDGSEEAARTTYVLRTDMRVKP